MSSIAQFSDSDQERFLAKVQLPADASNDCWIWQGAKHGQGRGYGKFRLNGKLENAHKAAYKLFKGRVRKGKVIGHRCNNEACVNPAHLVQQSQSANLKYCVRCGRHASQRTQAGSEPYSIEAIMRKLNTICEVR